MLLALDIGNTNVTMGVFDGQNLVCRGRLSTDTRRMPDEYGLCITNILGFKGVKPQDIDGAVICSVVPPLTPRFEEACRDYFKVVPFSVSPGVKTGTRVLVDNPKEVGTDRVVDTVAAFRLYGGPAIVVDFGTATVFDAISKQGDFLGGAIAPGVEVASQALHQATAQLLRVDLVPPKSVIGKNTVSNLQSGLFLGYVSLVEGMVKRFKGEMGEKSIVIATGGMAPVIAREARIFDHVNLDLTLIGLRMIYDLNQDLADGRRP
jgi:type III pantothenate kinase